MEYEQKYRTTTWEQFKQEEDYLNNKYTELPKNLVNTLAQKDGYTNLTTAIQVFAHGEKDDVVAIHSKNIKTGLDNLLPASVLFKTKKINVPDRGGIMFK